MGNSENAQQSSKKRGALKQLSRDNPGLDDEEDSAELESGTFKKASDEVLASRKIVRVKRKEPSSAAPAAASSNPFAGIQLVPTTAPVAPLPESELTPAEAVVEGNQKASEDGEPADNREAIDTKEVDVKDSAVEKTNDENKDPCGDEQVTVADDKVVSGVANISSNAVGGTGQTEKESAGDQSEIKEKEGLGSEEADKNGDNNGALSSFQQHSSSKNAFTGLATTEVLSAPFSFGSISQDGSGSLFGSDLPNSGASGSAIIKKSEGNGFPPKQEVSTETGEENEKVAFSADSVMFEYLDGGWKERGKGEVKVNVSSNGGKARLVMRAKGNYRLILNAGLYPEMKLASMDKKGITFACVNSVSEGKTGLSTFALKFKDAAIMEEFRVAVDKHKESKPAETALPLKTAENNSPTATIFGER